MNEWSTEELALLWRHNNEKVAELTGRSIEEVAARRIAVPGCQTCAECQGIIELKRKQRGM